MLAAVAASGNLCPPGAAALGVVGLGSVCQVAGGAAGLAGSAASQVTGFGVDSVLGALGSWVAEGAVWLLGQVGAVLTSTTSIDLGASWFTEHYETMAALCGVVVLPMLLLGVIQAIYRQDLSMLLRSVLVNVPLAMLLTAVAVKLVQLGLAITDELSSAVAEGAGLDAGHFMATVTTALSGGAASQPAVPAFIVFLGGIVVVVGAFLVWIELLIRAAAVYVAVLFLPLALASLAWPAIAHWCRRLVDTLVALILGKFVIVSVLSLAARRARCRHRHRRAGWWELRRRARGRRPAAVGCVRPMGPLPPPSLPRGRSRRPSRRALATGAPGGHCPDPGPGPDRAAGGNLRGDGGRVRRAASRCGRQFLGSIRFDRLRRRAAGWPARPPGIWAG